jgi:uncharacterized protein YhaN
VCCSSTSPDDDCDTQVCFSAADAAQLERRRTELEQQRFELLERLRSQSTVVHDLTAQRTALERQRAALLSARSIEHIQRELAAVQQKLELATSGSGAMDSIVKLDDVLCAASEFLAKLTNGDLTRIVRADENDHVLAVSRAGDEISLNALNETHRDQVYLSACLALLAAASRQGLRLPLVLDEPFEHVDERASAAMAAVLDDFCRQGHQVIVFTCDRAAAERLASLGAAAHDVLSLRHTGSESVSRQSVPNGDSSIRAASRKRSFVKRRKRSEGAPSVRQTRPPADETSLNDKSDAA